jgi:hypothetical protein
MENFPDDIRMEIITYNTHPLAQIVRASTIDQFMNHLRSDQAKHRVESCSQRFAFDQGRRDAAHNYAFWRPNIIRETPRDPDFYEMHVWLTPKEIYHYNIGVLHQRTDLFKLSGSKMDKVRWDFSLIYKITPSKLKSPDSD